MRSCLLIWLLVIRILLCLLMDLGTLLRLKKVLLLLVPVVSMLNVSDFDYLNI